MDFVRIVNCLIPILLTRASINRNTKTSVPSPQPADRKFGSLPVKCYHRDINKRNITDDEEKDSVNFIKVDAVLFFIKVDAVFFFIKVDAVLFFIKVDAVCFFIKVDAVFFFIKVDAVLFFIKVDAVLFFIKQFWEPQVNTNLLRFEIDQLFFPLNSGKE